VTVNVESARTTRLRLVAAALATGAAAGLALEVATFLVARYGPSGTTDAGAWSFRGNGALVVPLSIGPAVLAAGWIAIVLHYRGARAWLRIGIAAGVIGVLLALAGAATVVLGGPALATAGQVLTLLVFSLPILGPGLAGSLPIALQRAPREALFHVVAAVEIAAAMLVAFSFAASVLPPGS
jgi:hypothetical protein